MVALSLAPLLGTAARGQSPPERWTAVNSMTRVRQSHTATQLLDGRVLVTGGADDAGIVATAEVYDPATGSWSDTAPLGTSREFHTATLLPDGKVLVSGGMTVVYVFTVVLDTAEVWDPASGMWSYVENMSSARLAHTASLLPSGKVLVAGGSDNASPLTPLASAEIYDPGTGGWAGTGAMTDARMSHTMTALGTGAVLVAAGLGTSAGSNLPLASAEAYDPATGTWSVPGELAVAREFHTATLLPSGQVLVAGGSQGTTVLTSAELYDPAAGAWSATGSLATARDNHTANLLSTGTVLVAGGRDGDSVASAELYDPATGTWGATSAMTTPRAYHTTTRLASGKVLAAGGAGTLGTYLASAETFQSLGISPASVTLPPKASQSFTASGGSTNGYVWAFVTNASGGTLGTTGAYSAGSTGSVTDVIGVTDSVGNTATAIVMVTAALAISPTTATMETHQSRSFAASGGTGSHTWNFATNASGGALSRAGVYTSGGSGGVTDVIRVTDERGDSATATITVTSGGCASTGVDMSWPLLALAILPLVRATRRKRAAR